MVGELNFGILDPNAPAKAAESIYAGQRNQLAMQDARQQQQMNALAMQKQQQAMADENALRQAYAQSGGDRNKLIETLKGTGQYKQAMDLQDQMAASQAAQRKAQIEQGLQHAKAMDEILAGVKDQPTYDMALQQAAQIFGPEEVAKFNPVYNPEGIALFKSHAIGAKNQAELELKKIDQDLAQSRFAFDQTKNAQQMALERAKMGQAERHFQATQGMEREKMQAGKAGGAASEDERKAAGWLAQADNAYKNMLGAMAESKGAERPGLTESLAPEAVKGAFQSPARQKFVQATSSLSESLLRAATGAGVNKDEAAQKVKELTPTYFDSPEVRKQKLDAIPMYLESLKSRAGRAAPKDYSVPATSTAGAHPPAIEELLKKYGG